METAKLLEFLNKSKSLCALDYATCESERVNFLDLLNWDEQFTQKIDLGIIYISQKTLDQCTIIDGLNRLLSLSLLLHAVCECYKKTTEKNENAIFTIRNKYLLHDNKTKLRLMPDDQRIYDKIIFGEKLSGKEKQSSMFIILHKFWTTIKEEKIQPVDLFNVLNKIYIILSDCSDIPQRDLYYNLNKDKREINQLLLIENYLKNLGLKEEWDKIKHLYSYKNEDIKLFLKDFFITKLNNKFNQTYLYNYFFNYFETMLQYIPEDELIEKIKNSAGYYYDILNVNIKDENLKKALIQIKLHGGDDTFAYLLSIFEDYKENRITNATFLEILSTIDEYLKNRLKTSNNIDFNELIKYLNTFITCK